MESLIKELEEVAKKFEPFCNMMENRVIKSSITKLTDAANKVGRSWSNSFYGYHSKVYYRNFQEPPRGARFSIEWGLINTFYGGTKGEWKEYRSVYVLDHIKKIAGNPDLSYLEMISTNANIVFKSNKDDIISILELININHNDKFVERELGNITKQKVFTKEDFISHYYPKGDVMIRDTTAIQQGLQTPPHLDIISNLFALSAPIQVCDNIFGKLNKLINHIKRISKMGAKLNSIDSISIFIGHGHSLCWKDLKDFLQERLNLKVEEFNSVPNAGKSTKERLSELLNGCNFAFLVMTGEDEIKESQFRARENVVHEIGLFQGKIGFDKAIILLEDGCQEFSNIHGIGQIRFTKGKISGIFEEIRRVLEREKIIK